MANAFFNFVTRFISGTTVKAGPVNDRFSEVQSGFASVETAVKSALKFAGYSTSTPITATPNSFIQLNASGVPVASSTLGFSPNMGGYRVQNVGTATLGTDAPSYGQMTAYVATIAFGSPNVLTVPAFAGQSLKGLRLNVGETALEFASILPTPSAIQADQLITNDGNWVRAALGKNLALGSAMQFESRANYFWTKNVNAVVDNDGGSSFATVSGVSSLIGAKNIINLADAYLISCAPGQVFTASVDCLNEMLIVNSVVLFIEFLDGSLTPIGSRNTVDISTYGDGLYRRFSVTGTAPALATSFRIGAATTSTVPAGSQLAITNFKVERGAVATPWTDDATIRFIGDALSCLTVTPGLNTLVEIGNNGTIFDQKLRFNSGATVGVYGAEITARSQSGAVSGVATIGIECGRAIFTNTVGYSAVFDNGNTGATKTIDWPTNGAKQKATVNSNTTITLTALGSDIVVDGLRLMLQNNATGGYTTTFASAATLYFKGNIVPVMPTGANARMEVIFWWDGAGFLGSWCAI